MSMLTENKALEKLDAIFPETFCQGLEESVRELKTKVQNYSTIGKSLLTGPDFFALADCVTDDSVFLILNKETCTNTELYPEASYILAGSMDVPSDIAIQAFELDFFIHVAYMCCKNNCGFTSMFQQSKAGEWLKNVPTIEIENGSFYSFTKPIIDQQPANVVFVFNETSEDDEHSYLSSCGYYMVNESKEVIGKVVIMINSDEDEIQRVEAIELVRSSYLVDLKLFMGQLSSDYFNLKFRHLDS